METIIAARPGIVARSRSQRPGRVGDLLWCCHRAQSAGRSDERSANKVLLQNHAAVLRDPAEQACRLFDNGFAQIRYMACDSISIRNILCRWGQFFLLI